MNVDASLGTPDAPLRAALDHGRAMSLAAKEYDRVAALLERLTTEEWESPTECPGWDVRAMSGHILGMAQMAASVPEMLRQQAAATKAVKQHGGQPIDALTHLQVRKNVQLSTHQLVEQLRHVGERATRSRRRIPAFVRNRRMPQPQGPPGKPEWWTFGYLFDVILTRDPFMHRIDISRATGIPLELAADHEGILVDDVVRDWARRHGKAYRLDLTGPAGGSWGQGDGEQVSMDAVEFCRVLSGRAPGEGLLEVPVPF